MDGELFPLLRADQKKGIYLKEADSWSHVKELYQKS